MLFLGHFFRVGSLGLPVSFMDASYYYSKYREWEEGVDKILTLKRTFKN